jgi:hypothetical protein
VYKIVTGSLNHRLSSMLAEHGGMESNQGGNTKGLNSAHKAAVLMNIIADARARNKGLHIIYTDMKKAFPSVPYQGFIDALRVLGINENFVELIIDTQTDFFTIAKGSTGLNSRRQKMVGVHEGDCLSPTLFCLVMNMYNKWINTLPIGYQLDAPLNPRLKAITIASSTYMDDMALIEKSANETQQMLSYFERFLCYYGMSINSKKCAYRFRDSNSTFKPSEPITGWGKVIIYGQKLIYKYLGYFINISLDFSTQHKEMLKKLNKACNDLVCDHWLPLHEAITYVNSDLVSISKYRMYLISFPQSVLEKFDARLASAVKRLSAMPRSTTTDLLIDQGLQNVYLLQSTTCAQFYKTRSMHQTYNVVNPRELCIANQLVLCPLTALREDSHFLKQD